MEPSKCLYKTCESKAKISCICKLREKFFCDKHFMLHRKENPNIRHMFSDIWIEDEENNGLCEVCFVNSPMLACLCSNRSFLLCQDCISIHSRTGFSHSLEPLEAAEYAKQAGSISDYFNRKSKVHKIGSFLEKNLEECSGFKMKLRKLIESSIEKLQEMLNKAIGELESVEKDILDLKSKVEKVQFEYKLDLSDQILKIIDGDYEGIEKILKTILLFSVNINEAFFNEFDLKLIEVVNNVKEFTDDRQQILLYFDKNSKRMSESVRTLFRDIIDNKKELSKIYIFEQSNHIAQDLSVAAKSLNKLKSLDIFGQNIGPAGAKVLFSGMKGLVEIKEVNIGENYILDEGCNYLCEILPYFRNLENLFLDKNGLTDLSGKNLADYLKCCRNLKLLSLNHNNLGNEGLSWLIGALVRLEELEAVGLQKNQLTVKSGNNIARMLREIKKLQDLLLDDNQIDDIGAIEIMGAFEDIQNVIKIYFRNNWISDQIQLLLKEARKDKVLVATDNVGN